MEREGRKGTQDSGSPSGAKAISSGKLEDKDTGKEMDENDQSKETVGPVASKATRQLDREEELLQRLRSVAKHGRPGPCPRCESMLRVVSDKDGLRLECPMWRGGEGHRKPCGACAMPRSLVGRPAY